MTDDTCPYDTEPKGENAHSFVVQTVPYDGWRPIEPAPKDGTKVDLWIVDHDGDGWRIADAYYRKAASGQREGWYFSGPFSGDDEPCETPPYVEQFGPDRRLKYAVATHWKPVPGGPTDADYIARKRAEIEEKQR